jgi:hypothetical protein
MNGLSEDKMDIFLRKNYPSDSNKSYVGSLTVEEAEDISLRLKTRFPSVTVFIHPTVDGMRSVDCSRADFASVRLYLDGYLAGWNARTTNVMKRGRL